MKKIKSKFIMKKKNTNVDEVLEKLRRTELLLKLQEKLLVLKH